MPGLPARLGVVLDNSRFYRRGFRCVEKLVAGFTRPARGMRTCGEGLGGFVFHVSHVFPCHGFALRQGEYALAQVVGEVAQPAQAHGYMCGANSRCGCAGVAGIAVAVKPLCGNFLAFGGHLC